jgi:predicted DNA-binding transcriptional regulator YafY
VDQLQRLYKIDQLITLRSVAPIDVLLEELGGISLATLKRDITYMQDRLHAPIKFDRRRGGYVFDKGEQSGPKYELPGMWFNESELHALLTTQELLSNVEPGLLSPHLKPLQSKIELILSSLKDNPKEVSKRVRIFTPGRRKLESAQFEVVATATVRRQRLRLHHYNRGTNARTERTVSPQQIIFYRDNWYVDAWCHLRDDLRSFAIDAIELAELLPEKAKNLPLKEVCQTLGEGYGIFSGKSINWAKLRIGAEKARWVSRTVWHPDQKAKFEADGSYLLEVPYCDDRELVNDILALMPDVSILGPSALRRRVESVLEAGLQRIKRR